VKPMLETWVKTFQHHVRLYEPALGAHVNVSCWMCPSCGTAGPFFISEGERKRFIAKYSGHAGLHLPRWDGEGHEW